MMGSPLEIALDLADRGIPVFPCLDNKAPAVPGGFHAASTDPVEIQRMFALPGAVLVGMPTGKVSDIDVLDRDPRHGSEDWGRRLTLPPTRVHATRGGGWHHYYKHAPGLGCSVSRIAPGVDVRADGGYVIVSWPCSIDVPIAEWPADVLTAALTQARAAGDISHIEAPPSAAAVIDLLDRLPNPPENGRDVWVSVMLAAVGCVQVLEGNGEDADGIAEAACRWADKWPGSQGYDAELAKWESDWQYRDRPLAGWRNLCARAGRAVVGYAAERATAEFAEAPLPPAVEVVQPADDGHQPPAFSDESLALSFTERHAQRLRFVAAWGQWMRWNGHAWKADDTLAAYDAVRRVCRDRSAEANDPRVASSLASAKTVAAVERLAKSDRRHAATTGQWDTDPWVLNTPGGTVDLRSGRLALTIHEVAAGSVFG